ncbi:MAG: hypothetical protein GX568_07035 [Candidatus Gastranaerophilales bacterium]|nr:hypothetical protein [Candidatus Gastranaerophilales bacterium]
MYSAAASGIQYRNNEALRAKTNSERTGKVMQATKQGLVTDVFINSNRENVNISPSSTPLPADLREDEQEKANKKDKKAEKRMLWMVGVPLGVLAAGTIATGILAGVYKKKAAQITKGVKNLLTKEEKGPIVPPTINILTEEQYAAYEALRSPSLKTMIGAIAVFAFSSAALVLKNTVDGIKEISVKKKSADIQRDYQEKMIAVETRSFAGKKQIVRHMLDKKTAELNAINKARNISFEANKKDNGGKNTEKAGINPLHVLIGAGAAVASVFLMAKTIKNLRNIGKTAKETLKMVKPPTEKQESAWGEVHKMYGDKDGKPTMFTYLNDAAGYLYIMIMDPSKLRGAMFATMAAITGIGYAGTKFVEANKEIQVKKAEADINLNMNNKLVKVELANFMTKKNAAVDPLIKEYKKSVNRNPNDNEGLKDKYYGILDEIKNGPPFVYD